MSNKLKVQEYQEWPSVDDTTSILDMDTVEFEETFYTDLERHYMKLQEMEENNLQ